MPLIARIRKDPRIAVSVIGGCLVLAVATLLLGSGGKGPPTRVNVVYVMDVMDKKFYAIDPAPRENIPPLTATNGRVAVRAYVYGCGGCSESKRFVGYLEKFTDGAKEAKLRSGGVVSEEENRTLEEGHLVSAGGTKWVPSRSAAGVEIIQNALGRCDDKGSNLQRCDPSADTPLWE